MERYGGQRLKKSFRAKCQFTNIKKNRSVVIVLMTTVSRLARVP